MILNVDFALKLSNLTSLKRFICFKWIINNFSILHSQFKYHTLPVTPLNLPINLPNTMITKKLWKRETTFILRLLNIISPMNIRHSNCAEQTDPFNFIRDLNTLELLIVFENDGKTIVFSFVFRSICFRKMTHLLWTFRERIMLIF